MTFLKTSTQLQVWFDDVLEITWVYQDTDEGYTCAMRRSLTGLKFRGSMNSALDRVSTHYRYQTGEHIICIMTVYVFKYKLSGYPGSNSGIGS